MNGLRRMRLAVVAGLWVAGCGSADPPEVQVRAVIDAAETAAEARDVSALMDLVSPDYKDTDGRQPEELKRYLRGYFIANQSIHLLTRIERIEFPTTGVAEVELTVGMVGRETEAQSAWDLAADVYRIDLTLMDEEGDWRVTHLNAEPVGR